MCCFGNVPTIERLEIIGNNYMKITDECVHCIVKCLRNLRYLKVGVGTHSVLRLLHPRLCDPLSSLFHFIVILLFDDAKPCTGR